MNESLPPALRRRIAFGYVAMAVLTAAALAVCVFGAYVVWSQARAERLAASQPSVTATYLKSGDVRLEDGRVLDLWRPLDPALQLDFVPREVVDVVVFPGGERALLLYEVGGPDYPIGWRIFDWLIVVGMDLRGAVVTLAAVSYVVLRLVLGFTPLALPALLRGRESADAVLTDWRWTGRSAEALLTARVGDEIVRWEGRVSRDAQLRLGDTLHLVGHPRAGGWVVGWSPTARVSPTGPLHTPDAAVVRP